MKMFSYSIARYDRLLFANARAADEKNGLYRQKPDRKWNRPKRLSSIVWSRMRTRLSIINPTAKTRLREKLPLL